MQQRSIQERIEQEKRRQTALSARSMTATVNGSAPPLPLPDEADPSHFATEQDEALLGEFVDKMQRRLATEKTPGDVIVERGERTQQPSQPPEAAPGGNSRLPWPAPTPSPPLPVLRQLPAEGAILALSSGEAAVFNKDVPSKTYQLVYILNPDGSANSKGIYLAGYDHKEIGLLPGDKLAWLAETLAWQRDTIVYHLDDLDHASLIPQIAQPVATSTTTAPAEPAEAGDQPSPPPQLPPRGRRKRKSAYRRGQVIEIAFGGESNWRAVYWGRDQQGTVLAHETEDSWTLMHLDLWRFRETSTVVGELTEEELQEVEESLRGKYL